MRHILIIAALLMAVPDLAAYTGSGNRIGLEFPVRPS